MSMNRSLAVFALGVLVFSLSCQAAPPEGGRTARQAATALPYSVFVRSYDSDEVARTLAGDLSRMVPDHPAYVVAEHISGNLYHKVYSGALSDTTQAAVLSARLVDLGYLDPEDAPGALIQSRPLAFDLGDFPTREAAQARAAELQRRAVPAYALAVPLSDGTHRWKLYVGAFADSAQAISMRRMLASSRTSARLVERVGWPPPPVYGTSGPSGWAMRPREPSAPDAGPMPAIPAALRGCWRRDDGDLPDLRDQLIVTDTSLTVEGRNGYPESIDSVSPRSVKGLFVAEENGNPVTVATELTLEDDGGKRYLILREGDAGSSLFSRCAP
jgi:hypothetical protein